MEYYLPYLFWVGAIAASIVVILLLLSIIVGGDTEFDADVDSGGLGLIKSILIFIAVSSWTIRAVALNSPWTWIWSVVLGIIAGLFAVFIMSAALRFLWSRQESGNWLMQQTQGETGYVYVPIPSEGIGRVMLSMRGKERELDAISEKGQPLSYKEQIQVVDYSDEYVIVRPLSAIKQTTSYEKTI
jgi:membrane-bound ClpP family serine protease